MGPVGECLRATIAAEMITKQNILDRAGEWQLRPEVSAGLVALGSRPASKGSEQLFDDMVRQ